MTKKLTPPKLSRWQKNYADKSQGVVTTPTVAEPRRLLDIRTRQLYQGTELAVYTGRTGAMDAYALPSLVAGTTTPRKTPACIQCIK